MADTPNTVAYRLIRKLAEAEVKTQKLDPIAGAVAPLHAAHYAEIPCTQNDLKPEGTLAVLEGAFEASCPLGVKTVLDALASQYSVSSPLIRVRRMLRAQGERETLLIGALSESGLRDILKAMETNLQETVRKDGLHAEALDYVEELSRRVTSQASKHDLRSSDGQRLRVHSVQFPYRGSSAYHEVAGILTRTHDRVGRLVVDGEPKYAGFPAFVEELHGLQDMMGYVPGLGRAPEGTNAFSIGARSRGELFKMLDDMALTLAQGLGMTEERYRADKANRWTQKYRTFVSSEQKGKSPKER